MSKSCYATIKFNHTKTVSTTLLIVLGLGTMSASENLVFLNSELGNYKVELNAKYNRNDASNQTADGPLESSRLLF
ncbi:hypothetical protein Mal48_15660 [Thalassoglobus polymorphus]|uniref:Uncharacterized protein n=1 Tax=Thalassoglobus polymorphus TaxID=2527994 RepID=A0A517QL26_9PLAN|nr:hypothetical protein Mal48_15660 [Thalassoglobus polymorphus]